MDRLQIAPPYSQVFLTDVGDESFPAEFPPGTVQARPRGLRIATLVPEDGPTTIELAVDELLSVPAGAALAFEGAISTPGRAVELSDPERRVYWRHAVDAERVAVRVWVNDTSEPDYVGIELMPSRDTGER